MGSRIRFLAGVGDFSVLLNVHTGCGAHAACNLIGKRRDFGEERGQAAGA